MLDNESAKSYNATRRFFSRGKVCHAPSVNINFDQSGFATACCYNREHILGKYPENSVIEMWHGEAANRLRNYIGQGDFSHGCQMCQEQIEGGNYHGVRSRHYDKYASSPSQVLRRLLKSEEELQMPRCLEFELSNICNLECVMCNGQFSSRIRRNREKLPKLVSPYDDGFVEQIVPFLPYLEDAKFLGGEPFLIPIYYQIWDEIASHNPKIKVHITTNGTVYNNRVIQALDKIKAGIIISIDSIDKETYERIRVNANFDKVMINIERFRAYSRNNNSWFSFAVCPMRENWKEMPDMVRYCNANRTFVCFNTVYNPQHLSLQSLSVEELNEVIGFYEKQEFKGFGYLYRMNKKVFRGVINQLKEWRREKLVAPEA